MRYREHVHACANKKQGCTATWFCSAALIDNHDGWPETLCSVEEAAGTVNLECDECRESPRCEWCGAIAALNQPHDADCTSGVAVMV